MAHELTHVAQQGAAGQRAIQRQVQVGDAASPAEAEADAVAGAVTGGRATPAALIVDDGPVAPGQMLKSTFVEQLRERVTAAAADELGPLGSVIGCPYIDQYFARYAGQPAAEVVSLLRRFAPGARNAQSAADIIPAVVARVRDGVRQWRDTGQPPPDIAAADPAAAAAAGPAPAAPGTAQAKLAEPDSPADLVTRLGPGESLDASTAARMGDTFGESFAHVRIHTDANAARMADDRDATAFTIGSHVAFSSGAYAPGSVAGDALVAHELAHVVQQGGAGPAEHAVQRKRGDDDTAAESHADDVARGAVESLHGGGEKKGVLRSLKDAFKTDLSLKRCPRTAPAPTALPSGSLTPGGTPTHTTGAQLDTYMSASATVSAFVAPAIASGQLATGHVHFLNAADFITRFVAYSVGKRGPSGTTLTDADARALEPNVEAYRDGADICVHQDRGDAYTVVHEGIHLYSHSGYRTPLGFNINEGTTEWLARKVIADNSLGLVSAHYPNQHASIVKLAAKGGNAAVMRAYFQGDVAGLRTAIDTATSAGTFDNWVTFMKASNYASADALM